MAHAFGSQQWIDGVWAELRGDDDVRTHGVTWAHGPMLFVMDSDEKAGFDGAAVRLDLHEGESRDLRLAPAADARLSPVAIRGSYSGWKAVFKGEQDIVDAIMRGAFRMKGDLPALVRHRELLAAVVACAGRVPTTWQDEAAAAEGTPAAAAR